MIKNRIISLLGVLALFVLVGCGGDGKNGAASDYTLLGEEQEVHIVSIQVTPADIVVPKATTGEYTALAYYSDGSSEDISDTAEWTSTNPDVVSFNSSVPNHAEALYPGESTIFATQNGIKSNIAKVTVTDAFLKSIVLTPVETSVPKGIYVQYQAYGYYSDETVYDLTPYAAFSSSDDTVAVIQTGGSIPGLAQTRSVGNTTIIAVYDGKTSNTAELNVIAAQLVLIHITPEKSDVPKGTTGSFQAMAYYGDGSSHDITKQASWHSSAPSIVSIVSGGEDAGYAEALNTGESTITASFEGQASNKATVTVRDAVLKSIHITPETESVAKGVKVEYTAVGTYTDGSTHEISKNATWKSSDTDIATVYSTDISKATIDTHGEGDTYITVQEGDIVSNDALLSVTEREIYELRITPDFDQTMNVDQKTQLTVTAYYTDGFSHTVTHDAAWFSNAATIASVENGSSGGLVTANSPGNAEITAVYEGITSNIKHITVIDNGPEAVVSYGGCSDGGDGWWHHQLVGSSSTGTNLTYKWTVEADGSLDDTDRVFVDDSVADAVLKVYKGAEGIDLSAIVVKLMVSNASGESSALVIPYFAADCTP